MSGLKKWAKSFCAVSKAAEKVWTMEALESRAMVQAGANLVEGWDIQLWWDGYGTGWTQLQRERVGSDQWATLETNPDGDNATFTDTNTSTDPDTGLSPGLTYTYRLVNAAGGTQSLGTYTTARYGDVNLDGVVDDTDFDTWLDGYFSGGSTWQQGDFTNDGTIDDGDWSVFLTAYNDPTEAPTTSVHGAAGALTGTPYTLDFSYDSNTDPSDYWLVNWGDGTPQQLLPGNARSAQHSFASAGDFNVQVGVAAAGSRDMTNGVFSAGSHVVHVQAAPTAPSGVAVTGTTQSSVSVAWTNNDTSSTGVILSVTQNGAPFNSYTLPATQNTFTLDGLDQNTSYGFSVAAQNYAATSTATTTASAATNPGAPTSVTATPDASGHEIIHWTDNTGGVASHIITGDNGAGATATLATIAPGTTTATITVPSGSTIPITVTAQTSSGSSTTSTATVADQPQPFGVAPQTWDYGGASAAHLANNTVTATVHDIPTHNNLAVQWVPFDADPGFTTTDTTTRTITLKVDGTTLGTVSYVFDSFDSDGTAQFHESDQFTNGLGTNNGGVYDVANASHTAATATVTFTGEHFGSTGFWTLNSPAAVWSRPTVTIAATKVDGTEATPGDSSVEFQVRRDGNLTNSLIVYLEAPAGTATNGVDYDTLPSTVTIPAGSDHATVQLGIIDDTKAEGPETIKISIKPASDNTYAIGQFAQTTLVVHDNPTAASVDIAVAPPGDGDTQENLVSGFSFFAQITVKGEALDQTTLEMQVFSTTTMEDGVGVQMTNSEIATFTGIDAGQLNTGQLAPGQAWPDASGFGRGGYFVVPNTHAGTGNDTSHESFHEDSTGFPGDTPDYYTNVVDLTRQYTIRIFAGTTSTTPLFSKDWSYSWTNKSSQYQTGQQPAPTFNTGAVSYNNNNKGTFYNINGIDGLAALN
jgi:hypothetical protein